MPIKAAALVLACLSLTPSGPSQPVDQLSVFDFYVGTLVPERQDLMPWTSEVRLEWGVGRQALRFTGLWEREGQPREFVNGLVAWDPVEERIRITAAFYHGAFFNGQVRVLDPERRVIRREWVGHYRDGQVVEYRETWTPVSDDSFEWQIEVLREGDWQNDLPPGFSRPPTHRIVRAVEQGAQRTGLRPAAELCRLGSAMPDRQLQGGVRI